MIARDVGEGAGRKPDAVEPVLRKPVARSLERQMRHPVLAGEPRQRWRAASRDRASCGRDIRSPSGPTTPTVPMLAARKPIACQIWRTKAATEVLPLVPVTATQ